MRITNIVIMVILACLFAVTLAQLDKGSSVTLLNEQPLADQFQALLAAADTAATETPPNPSTVPTVAPQPTTTRSSAPQKSATDPCSPEPCPLGYMCVIDPNGLPLCKLKQSAAADIQSSKSSEVSTVAG